MKKIAMLLIMGGILLILSLDATAGITYPRNQMSIIDSELREFPWEQPLTSYPRVTQVSIGNTTIRTGMDNARMVVDPIPFYYRVLVSNFTLLIGFWNNHLSDYEKEDFVRLPLRH